jgi:aspartyl-tRNA(Asn)/glutamyl-tRNA(Gln) amidotransferase subunit A
VTAPGDGEVETASEMARSLRGGGVSSVELTERALSRAGAWQPVVNAFTQIWADEALAEARWIDAARAGGQDVSPWAGVPLVVKDLYDVAGHETSSCSKAFAGNVAARDAPVIERLRRAGLILVGKTNQQELAAGGTNLESSYGPTRNPWDLRRMTGGSSGGSAAAVAAGVLPWSLGSDTGGSIRIPSALCGTFGLKPTTGRLPIEGLMPLAPSMDCPGPIAGTAEDLSELHHLMAGGTPAGPGRPQSVAVLDGFFADHIAPEVSDVVEDVAATLRRAGIEVVRRDGRGIEGARRVWRAICYPEFAEAYEHIRDRRHLIDEKVRGWMERGDRYTPQERAEAARRRREIGRWYAERLDGVSALLIPTTPYAAPRLDQRTMDLPGGTFDIDDVGPGYITSSVNLAGLPALNLPAGRSPDGLPIGVSLIGRDDAEPVLLRLAVTWEEATGYRPASPLLPG